MTERRLPKTAVENLVEDLASKANADLSNLDAAGQAKFDAKANISLNNLDATGQAKFDAKANVSLNNLDATGQAKFDAKANTDLGNLSTAGQAILNGKANTDASNFTATGKQTVVGWGMPGYFSKPRVLLTSGVWNYASKNILVTTICNQNIQGEIYINATASDAGAAEASSCVSPASGGKSSCQALIRKGIYYKAVFNNVSWYDELMEG